MTIAAAAALLVALAAEPTPLPRAELAPAGELVRVRLKSKVPGVHLVRSADGQPLCSDGCESELLLSRAERYALIDAAGAEVASSITLPSATRALLRYEGRDLRLLTAGIAGCVLGAASAITAVVFFVAAAILAGTAAPNSPALALAREDAVLGLSFFAAAAVFGGPGIVLVGQGAQRRWELIDGQN